jgi:hypothetical protein
MIAFQVRRGLGVMPAFDEKQISKQELADLVFYLDEVEELEPPRAARASQARRGWTPHPTVPSRS